MSAAYPIACITIEAVPDLYPEYTETFYVGLYLSNSLDMALEPEPIPVDIIDDDGESDFV